jgi:hypothetical protein
MASALVVVKRGDSRTHSSPRQSPLTSRRILGSLKRRNERRGVHASSTVQCHVKYKKKAAVEMRRKKTGKPRNLSR